ncbi:MAG: hypothetical protein FRX49_10654 [Trebouxia sp. A1-2]|nr:MAG: hypothetical protein FRX49_10654 [Trebouxia sp. A1-2]
MHKFSSHAFPAASPTPPQPERMTGPATRQVSALSAALARRRLAQQSRRSATRGRKGAASRLSEMKQAQSQTLPQLGTTQLGRSMLQRKVESFADMVALVTPPKPARQVQNATEVCSPQYPKPFQASASASQSGVVQRRPGSPTSSISSHPGAGRNTYSSMPSYMQNKLDEDAIYYAPEVATALSNPHLRRLHDAAAAWKRCQSQETGHVSGFTRQRVPKQAALPLFRPKASPSLISSQPDTQARLNKSHRANSAASFSDAQLHHCAPAHDAPDTGTNLGKLEASALQLHKAHHVLSGQVKSTTQTDNGMDTRFNDPATSVTLQEPQQGHERHHPAALQGLPNASSRHNNTGDLPDLLLDERLRQVGSVPPPPPRPAQLPKASWWAAIKGDAPPWLL